MVYGNASRAAVSAFSRSYRWSGYALGFAIGGFFDGILLHQINSLVPLGCLDWFRS